MKKEAGSLLILFAAILAFPLTAFAHVIVTPSTVGIAKTQTFNISVPDEKDNPTTSLRLLIPDGLQDVSPTVAPGWTISTKQTGTGDSAQVTEIDWTGGSIPGGQREDFTFQAQVPAQATTLKWKAYQTFSDGTVVSWTQDPVPGHEEDDSMTPYSQTMVVNDLTSPIPSTQTNSGNPGFSQTLSIIALALSAVAISLTLRKKPAK